MNVQEYLQMTNELYDEEATSYPMQKVRNRIECEDGWSVSVQAGDTFYSEPRDNMMPHYSRVECGYPDAPVPEYWLEYAENELGKTWLQDKWMSAKELTGAFWRFLLFKVGLREWAMWFSVSYAWERVILGRARMTIYPYIPIELVERAIEEHGGINMSAQGGDAEGAQ